VAAQTSAAYLDQAWLGNLDAHGDPAKVAEGLAAREWHIAVRRNKQPAAGCARERGNRGHVVRVKWESGSRVGQG